MSCTLKETASIQGLSDLLCWLCPHLNIKQDDDFSQLGKKGFELNNGAISESNYGWLDDCLIALSPTIDLMAIASRNRLAILTSRWEKNENGEKNSIFSVNWKGVVGHCQEGDEITCVVCLPIISQNKSSSGAPDWTSVIVGFKSGFIAFYTENGLPLVSQIFEEKAVVDISVRTYIPKNFGACVYSDLSEELLILYPRSAVSIDGFGLLQTLKACRNQAAKAAAVGGDCSTVASLGYKKWSLSEQEEVVGCVSTGMVPPHLYDHILLMSNLRGFNQAVSGGVPTTTLLLSVGRAPYLASFSVREGMTQPFMSDIAIHYASKLKNALVSAASGWLFGNKVNQDVKKERRKIEQPVPIPFRYTLPDKRRLGLSIRLSPTRRLATVTDDFGRVNVIDVHKCYVVRMFKGYRDAECGWVTVVGELNEMRREVQFLVVHAPRKNIMEVWLPQQGPRIAAFNISKGSRLIYTPHTLLGASTQHSCTLPTTPVVIMNPEGVLQRVSIPFHLALSGKTSRQARDLHLLKSIKGALRSKPLDHILGLVKEIKTTSVKIQLVTAVVTSKDLSLPLAKEILEELSPKEKSLDDSEMEVGERQEFADHDSRLLSQQLLRLRQLLRLFTFLSSLHEAAKQRHLLNEESLQKSLCSYFKLSEQELDRLLMKLKDKVLQTSKTRKVCFTPENLTFSKFLQSWEINVCNVDKEAKSIIPVGIKKKLASEDLISLGRFLFGWHYNPSQLRDFGKNLIATGLVESELLDLSFVYWTSLTEIDERVTSHFFSVLLLLVLFIQPHLNPTSLSEVKPLWENIRAKIVTWNDPLSSLIAILICRGIESTILIHAHAVGQQLGLSEESENSPSPLLILDKFLVALETPSQDAGAMDTDPSEPWEEFSLEVVEWNLQLKKAYKLVEVQRFYNLLTKKEGVKPPFESPEYSIKVLSLKGKGYLTELIAKWFIMSEIPVKKLVEVIKTAEEGDKEEQMEQCSTSEAPVNMEEEQSQELVPIKEQFECLRKHFPESTKADVLLVNLTWEFAAAWKKAPNNISFYEDSIRSLQSISNAFFKHGVSCMLWETWIVHYVQSTAQLIEKVSRRPKDRLILREIGISEFSLEKFYSLTKELLENIMTGNLACEMERPPIVGKDDFWKDLESVASLAEVTVAQKMTSCDLTFLHHQLICVLCLIVKYDLKNVRPFSLFPERERAAFFKPLISSWRVTTYEGREVVSSSQLSFLTRVVSAAVIAMPDPHTHTDIETPTGLNDAIEIGRSWGVSLDAIRRHYVCELYSSGLDSLAEQALIMVRDGVIIGSQMVVIAGQRLRHLITSSPKSIEIMALITPNVKEWCKSLEPGNLRCLDIPVQQTLKMVNKTILLIPTVSREYKVASNLAIALDMINNANLFPAT